MKDVPTTADIETALRACLAQTPLREVRVVDQPLVPGDAPTADLVAAVADGDVEQLLVLAYKRSGHPRHIRDGINQLLRWTSDYPGGYPVVIAPFISPRGAEICRGENVGYVDLAGNCRLAFGRVFIERAGRPNPHPQRREQRSLYALRATRILHALLLDPRRTWKLAELAHHTRTSIGHVANVTRRLRDRDWLRKSSAGVLLVDPGALLFDWAREHSHRRGGAYDCYAIGPVAEMEALVARACRGAGLRYVLTGFSAAARYAPAVRYQRVTAYVENDLEELASRLGFKAVTTGANVRLLRPYDDGVFLGRRDFGEIVVASPIQTYLDVRDHPERGPEAADMLLRQVIQPTW